MSMKLRTESGEPIDIPVKGEVVYRVQNEDHDSARFGAGEIYCTAKDAYNFLVQKHGLAVEDAERLLYARIDVDEVPFPKNTPSLEDLPKGAKKFPSLRLVMPDPAPEPPPEITMEMIDAHRESVQRDITDEIEAVDHRSHTSYEDVSFTLAELSGIVQDAAEKDYDLEKVTLRIKRKCEYGEDYYLEWAVLYDGQESDDEVRKRLLRLVVSERSKRAEKLRRFHQLKMELGL